jgi:hypothetical protein
MNRAQNRMYRMIERFEESRGNMSIGDYFQVPMKITIKHSDFDQYFANMTNSNEILISKISCIFKWVYYILQG